MTAPFLKWAGGKRWFVNLPEAAPPSTFRRYLEPFLGGGAMYFSLAPRDAILSDLNEELIECYVTIRDHHQELEILLSECQAKHSLEYYYRIRSVVPDSPIERAARFLYLNRTCWNGLYRVNRKGQFNVPIGTKNKIAFQEGELDKVSKALKNATIMSCDFETTVDLAQRGDYLFVDPPYTVNHNANGFLKYNESIFSWSDQVRLVEALKRAACRGASIAVTNADHESVRQLYEGFGTYSQIARNSVLAGMSSKRGAVSEALFKSNF